jgi:UDP:flavonoid glycosyltransferase YjiC (YdhE family)
VRVLFASQPIRSHFHSMAPVALAARSLGHAVGVASGPRLEPLVRRLGFDFLPCGLDFDPARDQLSMLPGQGAPGDAPLVVRQLAGFSGGLGPAFARDLLAQGRAWRPDLIVREPVEFGSVVAAERWRIPYASVMWAIYIDPRFLIRDALARVCREFGLDGDRVIDSFDRHLVLKFLPPAWRMARPPEPPTTLPFCAPPFDHPGDEAPPGWVASLPARPTIYATLGLTFSQAPDLFRAMLDALGGIDASAVVTVGTELDPAALGPVPPNVRVERYVPASLLLPHCDVLVFHGGFNSLHGALWSGVPMVVVPQGAGDQTPTAEKVAELGLGAHVPGPVPRVEDVRRAIVRVLAEPAFTAAARAMRAQMLALPPLGDAVERLAALAASAPVSSQGRAAGRA